MCVQCAMCNVKGHASMQSGRLFALYGKACHANQKKRGAKPAVNVRENASWFSSFLRTCLFSFFFFLIGNQKFINKEKKEKKSTSCS